MGFTGKLYINYCVVAGELLIFFNPLLPKLFQKSVLKVDVTAQSLCAVED
jgi:hypothetical protein